MRAPAVLVLVLVLGACGTDDRDQARTGDTITGRLVSRLDDTYCVSPDRGETQTCVSVLDPTEGVDVGECVTASPARNPTAVGSRIEVVAEAACAAGDLGDGAPSG